MNLTQVSGFSAEWADACADDGGAGDKKAPRYRDGGAATDVRRDAETKRKKMKARE